jgi:phage tail-like protein
MPVQIKDHKSTIATDPLRNFKFQVNISHTSPGGQHNYASLGFVSCGGLSVTTESIPYRQGGMNTTVQQIPGQTTFTPITLQRGVLIGTSQSWDWMKELFTVVAGNGSGGRGRDYRSNMEILVLDHPITDSLNADVRLRFKVYNCWPTHVGYTDLNAGENALLIEQVTFMHEGFDVSWAPNTGGAEAAAITP